MNVTPLIIHELQVASRRLMTYRVRTAAAGLLFLTDLRGYGEALGKLVFMFLGMARLFQGGLEMVRLGCFIGFMDGFAVALLNARRAKTRLLAGFIHLLAAERPAAMQEMP